jgi:hypothetical protein
VVKKSGNSDDVVKMGLFSTSLMQYRIGIGSGPICSFPGSLVNISVVVTSVNSYVVNGSTHS